MEYLKAKFQDNKCLFNKISTKEVKVKNEG